MFMLTFRYIPLFILLAFCYPAMATKHNFKQDGHWKLTIEGHHDFVYGDFRLAGWLRLPWQVEITFDIKHGQWLNGTGKSYWQQTSTSSSQPKEWVSCQLINGTYMNASMSIQKTPHMRFPAFPVSGQLKNGLLSIEPGYQDPWNYLAVTYRCHTDIQIADNWFTFAERAKQEEGKRQNADTRIQGKTRFAKIKEVKLIPPEGTLTIPLQHGWSFTTGNDKTHFRAKYSLKRITN